MPGLRAHQEGALPIPCSVYATGNAVLFVQILWDVCTCYDAPLAGCTDRHAQVAIAVNPELNTENRLPGKNGLLRLPN